MVATIRTVLHFSYIILALLSATSRCRATYNLAGGFEVVLNNELTFPITYSPEERSVRPLRIEPVDVFTAQIEKPPDPVPGLITYAYCILRSAAPTNYISSVFSDISSLTQVGAGAGVGADGGAGSFPSADAILCVAHKSWMPRANGQIFLYLEDDAQRFSLTHLSVFPLNTMKQDIDTSVRYTKIALANVPGGIHSKCRFKTTEGETLILSHGRSWESEIGIYLAQVKCFSDIRVVANHEDWLF